MERELTTAAESFAPLHPGSDRIERGVTVEVLGNHGQVRYRTRVKTLPAVLGRGYDCDVLLDDPHVDPRHAELVRDENGTLVMRDLGSVNGIKGKGADTRAERLTISSGDRVRVGSLEIRVIEADHPVAAAVPISAERRLTSGIAAPRRALAVCGGALLATALIEYQGSVVSDALVPAIQASIYVLVALAIWASAWALATRIVSRGFRLVQHWAWASTLMIAGLVLNTVGEWIDFLGPGQELGSLITGIGGLILFPIAIAGHLEIASNMSSKRRWRAALSVGAIVVGLAVLASIGEEEMTWSIEFPGTLKPLPASVIGGVSLDDFMESTSSLQEEVDELAKEPPPKESGFDAAIVVPDP